METRRIRPMSAVALALALTGAALVADGGPNHRVSSDNYGVSGGNVNDSSRAFCCSGTLGALLRDSNGGLHILSNNHVLARSNQATAGEEVSQPGLVDSACRVAEVVANLSAFAPLGSSNVDAAIAALQPGAMNADGVIEDIGAPSSAIATPAVGVGVAKSGRTTGLTTGSIGAINANVQVQYSEGCGSGRRFFVIFTNQVVIHGSAFSAGGDSGSLIVTNDANHNPVALLYAGSSATTIGNPIGEVLSQLGSALGSTLSFDVDGKRPRGRGPRAQSSLSTEEIARATRAKDAHAPRLMSDPAVVGVGVGEDADNPGRSAVVVYLQRGLARAAIARDFDGVAVRVIETDPIVAFGWNEPAGGSCKAR